MYQEIQLALYKLSGGQRDLQAVNITAVIIPRAPLAPSFRKLPVWQIPALGLIFWFRNDEKIAHFDVWLWGGLCLALL